jgi:predicted small secreted protein
MTNPKRLAALAMLIALPLLSACYTTAGAGKDVSNAGTAVENSALKHAP